MTAWFVLRTGWRREAGVIDAARKLGFPTWAPFEVWERGRARREVRRPLLEGYVFTACGPFGFGQVAAIDGTAGFLRALHPDGVRRPASVARDDLVPLILAELCGAFDHRAPVKPVLAVDSQVRVTAGLWRGYLGQLVARAEKRATVAGPWGRLVVNPDLLEAVA